ncbi:hypothetical protein EYF80_022598 [Liparis tanakae]|uniref:Uncharacterized protein n=1 Tax=Liparis tanakae TaxID=230148 RepID=A0A4Z2HNP8_9TELE|nr:hypothetical protein EYF80_022598 [Liparis tanakae]
MHQVLTRLQGWRRVVYLRIENAEGYLFLHHSPHRYHNQIRQLPREHRPPYSTSLLAPGSLPSVLKPTVLDGPCRSVTICSDTVTEKINRWPELFSSSILRETHAVAVVHMEVWSIYRDTPGHRRPGNMWSARPERTVTDSSCSAPGSRRWTETGRPGPLGALSLTKEITAGCHLASSARGGRIRGAKSNAEATLQRREPKQEHYTCITALLASVLVRLVYARKCSAVTRGHLKPLYTLRDEGMGGKTGKEREERMENRMTREDEMLEKWKEARSEPE